MKAVPVTRQEASDFINRLHRHHAASVGYKFAVGAADDDGNLIGVAVCGRPVARHLDDGTVLELTRLCTDGSRNACSFLYSKCARIAKEMGYRKIITYILETEPGTSLRASGWTLELQKCGGDTWENCRRTQSRPVQVSMFPEKEKYPVGILKQRWSKEL